MRVKILSLTGDTVRFLLIGSNVAFANALRRTMVAEVPCMSVDDIFIFDNSSLLPDETLAHRIGLIPLKTDLDSYVLPERCNCNSDLGCSLCRVVLTLDVEADEKRRVVYSGDIASEDPTVIPASPDIPVVKLAPGQAIRFEAYARLGLGKMHAKWQPVSMCTYQHVADIEIDEVSCTLCRKCIDACPRRVIEIDGNELKIADLLSCILCGACVEACPIEPPAIRQGLKNDTFLFTVESAGGLPPERIVSEAAKILTEKLNEFSNKVRRGETDEDIEEFEATEEFGRGLYSIGAGDYEDQDEEGE